MVEERGFARAPHPEGWGHPERKRLTLVGPAESADRRADGRPVIVVGDDEA